MDNNFKIDHNNAPVNAPTNIKNKILDNIKKFVKLIRDMSKKNKIMVVSVSVVALIPIVTGVFFISNKVFGGHNNEIIKPNVNSDRVTTTNKSKIGMTSNQNGDLQEYDYTEASNHIGERAIIKGKVLKVFTSKNGVTFFDFCEDFKNCSFSAVIFASDLKKFPDISKYQRDVAITGTIKDYQGKAEIILNSPDQIK